MDRHSEVAARILFDPETWLRQVRLDLGLESVLTRNRAPMAIVGDQYPEAAASSSFGGLIRTHQERRDLIARRYSTVANEWLKSGIPSVLIKSPGYFPYTSDNVDTLIHERDVNQAVEVLSNLGYIEITTLREPYKLFFRCVESNRPAVHLHWAVAWINKFLTAEAVIDESRKHDDVPWWRFPAPEYVALITIAHWFYEDKHLALRDLFHIGEAVKSGVDWHRAEALAQQGGWVDGWREAIDIARDVATALGISQLKEALPRTEGRRLLDLPDPSQASTTLPLQLPKMKVKLLHFKKSLADSRPALGERCKEVALLGGYALLVKTPFQLRRPRRCVVAISGIDGSGKTTLANQLDERLRGAGIHVTRHWMRPGTSPLLELLKRGASTRQRRQEQRLPLPTRRRLRPRAFVVVIDYVARLWVEALKARFSRGVHIFDRHALDAAVDLSVRYRSSGYRLLHWAPRPDIQILLSLDPETAHLRGTSPEELAALEEGSRVYAENLQHADVVLNSAYAPAEMVNICVARIAQHLRKRGS